MIRRLVESSLRGIRFRRRLPKAFNRVPIVVSPSCGLRYLRPNLARVDPSLLRLADNYVKPGSVVWDVGANAGLFAFASAAKAGPAGAVYAFEADNELVTMLYASTALQPSTSSPVTVVPVAVAKAVEPRTFAMAKRSRSTNHLSGYGGPSAGGVREERTVMAMSLDWGLDYFRAPAVLKIDVEGAELEVLNGAEKVLRDIKPVIICEASGGSSIAVAQILHRHGYRITNGDLPDDGKDLDTSPWNTLAFPPE